MLDLVLVEPRRSVSPGKWRTSKGWSATGRRGSDSSTGRASRRCASLIRVEGTPRTRVRRWGPIVAPMAVIGALLSAGVARTASRGGCTTPSKADAPNVHSRGQAVVSTNRPSHAPRDAHSAPKARRRPSDPLARQTRPGWKPLRVVQASANVPAAVGDGVTPVVCSPSAIAAAAGINISAIRGPLAGTVSVSRAMVMRRKVIATTQYTQLATT